jgi:sucrose phosphorylase
LGENEQKLLLARAIQLFMPGIPQIWYLDLFAGKNDYAAADNAGADGHKEINRTNLGAADIAAGLKSDVVLKQLELLRLRNTSKAFLGKVQLLESNESEINILWQNDEHYAQLEGNLKTLEFSVKHSAI